MKMQSSPNHSFESATMQEWLLTNGIGGFAASTICGANTRRYHGLLTASFNPPTDRRVLVSKVEETVFFNTQSAIALGSNRYPGAVHPRGFEYLESFERMPLPKAVFAVQDLKIAKTVFMVEGSNTTVVEYENTGETAFCLQVTPLWVCRDYHSLMHEAPEFNFWYQNLGASALQLYPRYGSPALYFGWSAGDWHENRSWYKNVEYDREHDRGLDFQEDNYALGYVDHCLKPGQRLHLVFSTEEKMLLQDPETLKMNALQRLVNLNETVKTDDSFYRDLVLAGEQFIVERHGDYGLGIADYGLGIGDYGLGIADYGLGLQAADAGQSAIANPQSAIGIPQSAIPIPQSETVIAGYPWFTDWGRDTMIALRGLAIATGKKELTESILRTFLKFLDGGMLPNRFPDQGEEPEYNTLDATLWMFIVLYEYQEAFGDEAFIGGLMPKLEEIIEAHIRGTRYNIHVTPEGLLFGGEGLSQLTWMDARVGDYVVTPRQGCPVEINALWYNALRIFDVLAEKSGYTGKRYAQLAGQVEKSFLEYFRNDKGYLNDVIIPGVYADDSIRPNQVYALSLPFPLLSGKGAKAVLDVVEKHLLTPLGLRTLSPEHPDFKPVYAGSPWDRDTAYHQGTVWPFLLAEYWLAYLRSQRFSAKSRQTVRQNMEALSRHFYEDACLYGISEVFDGANPTTGKGCFHQAWSVGMLLVVLNKLGV